MNVAGVDERHHERRRPGLQVLLEDRLVARRLLRPLEPRRQRERILQHRNETEILGGRLERRLGARGGAAGQRAAHVAHAALDAGSRRAEHLLCFLLHIEHAEFERQRVEPAGKHDARAARFRRRLMLVDHLPHPDRLAAEIEIVGAGGDAGRQQFVAVELIRTDRRDHRLRLLHHRLQRRGIAGIGHDQRRIRRRADRVADGGELVLAAPGHRPFQTGVALVMRGEIFGDELAGEAGGAIDDDVEFRRRHIRFPLVLLVIASAAKQSRRSVLVARQ